MRVIQKSQMSLGDVNIADIQISTKSRDDIPAILLGLQYIYTTPDVRDRVFEILKQVIPDRKGSGLTEDERSQKANPNRGRPGMEQWKILVLGTLRLGLNTDFDRIHELANQHGTIRQMLGHGNWEDNTEYSLQAIKDNLKLFTPEILDKINQEVVKAGHALVKKKSQSGGPTKKDGEHALSESSSLEKLRGRVDSFVVETDVHFPTDINLFYDSVRKMTEESFILARTFDIEGWRQYKCNIKKFKKQFRKLQKLKPSAAKDEAQRELRQAEIHMEYMRYISMGISWKRKSEQILEDVKNLDILANKTYQLEQYQNYTQILSDQIYRRVILGEKIPHEEKIFSIFEPHTEWINKGKAGVAVELGLRVCVMEDQHQFILFHKVMEKETDDKIAVEMVSESRKRFPQLAIASFDKGFHSPRNQIELKEHLEQVILPKKGRLSEIEKQREGSEEFKKYRRQHSAVESAINALEQHGLDVCPDHGIDGFKRYVSLAVVARNIHRLGSLIKKQQQEKERRKRGPYKKAA